MDEDRVTVNLTTATRVSHHRGAAADSVWAFCPDAVRRVAVVGVWPAPPVHLIGDRAGLERLRDVLTAALADLDDPQGSGTDRRPDPDSPGPAVRAHQLVETPQQLCDDGERSPAIVQAEAGATAWLAVVGAQQDATPDHADFVGLAGYLLDTLAAVESLARVLGRQVEGYRRGLDAGRVVSDDRGRDPHQRLVGAARDLDAAAQYAGSAAQEVHRFFSAIEHIDVQDAPSAPDVAGDPASSQAEEEGPT